MTQKVRVTFAFDLTEGQGVIRGRRNLLYDPKVAGTFEVGFT